ncbi:esterase-like activity of phytase family protein [Actinoplanes sp. NPDC048988]|uniref:esterase-like activity of phytase family protein n=1 Tax=Actinoplanes sp. NPDC048988 TaxID=3363901 RepID=UPI0037185A4C
MRFAFPARRRLLAPAVAAGVLAPLLAVPGAEAAPASAGDRCAPSAKAVSYSDSLNKTTFGGVAIGGLSGITYDKVSRGYVSVVDRSGTQPASLVFLRDPGAPRVTATTALKRADGTAYDGTNFDGEGIAVAPNGNFLVTSEAEPSIRVFGRDGVQRGELTVPARFAVTPGGEAPVNATLEGLAISRDGKRVYAAMEGALSGDAPATGEALRRRVLVYEADGRGGYRLARQIGYEADPGYRVAEVAAYDDGRLVVLEATFTAGVGNGAKLYAISDKAPDVSKVANLSTVPAHRLAGKKLVTDLVTGPTLGATNPQPQINPLLDNLEGMAVERSAGRGHRVYLISDDNFSANQVTRVITLQARLP